MMTTNHLLLKRSPQKVQKTLARSRKSPESGDGDGEARQRMPLRRVATTRRMKTAKSGRAIMWPYLAHNH